MPGFQSTDKAAGAAFPGDKFTAMEAGARGAATSQWSGKRTPSAAELEAGTYSTGPVTWQGLGMQIENPAHTVREGTDPDGVSWRGLMKAHYGFIDGTRGADGDEVDVFLGPAPESEAVWILNQRDAAGGFDEHKVLAGFVDARQAVDTYRLSYSAGWDRYAPPIPVTLAQLRWWLKFADLKRPFSLDLVPPESDMTEPTKLPLSRVFWDSAAEPTMGQTLTSVLYALRRHDGTDGLLLDPLSMADITDGATVVALDALVTEAGKLKPKMEALLRIMEMAGGEVKPVAVQFSDLLRRFGGVHVAVLYELSDGQTITAWFHKPDGSPGKFSPADELVSWKWQLNKKDVTIAVAPESGKDLNVREVARRLMKLAEKNSAAFTKANAKRAGVMQVIGELKDRLAERQGVLAGLHGQIEVARGEADAREAAKAATSPAMARLGELGWTIAGDGKSAQKAFQGVAAPGEISDGTRSLSASISEEGTGIGLFTGFDQIGVYLRAELADAGDSINKNAERWATERRAELAPKVATPGERGAADFAAGKPYEVPADITDRGDIADWKRNWQGAKNTADAERYFAWEEDLTQLVEAEGVTRSDAQAMVEAAPQQLRGHFVAGLTPAEAFAAWFTKPAEPAPAPMTPVEGYARGMEIGRKAFAEGGPKAGKDHPDLQALLAGAGKDLNLQLRIGYRDGYDETEQHAPAVVPPEVLTLREVLAGQHDTMNLANLLSKIEDAVKALDAAGLLKDAIDAEANAAITYWAKLDELANG